MQEQKRKLSNLQVTIIILLFGILIISLIGGAFADAEDKSYQENSAIIKALEDKRLSKNLMNTEEIADYLGISKKYVIKLRGGDYVEDMEVNPTLLPYIKVDNRYFYSKPAVDKWLRESETTYITTK